MAVSAPASLSKIRAEFGTSASNLKSFYRSGGYVANHENNAAIASSATSLRISQFVNTDTDFEATATGVKGTEGYTTTSFGVRSFVELAGTLSVNEIGKSKSSLDQATLIQLFDYYNGANLNTYAFSRFSVSGDHRYWAWTTLNANATSVNRSASSVPDGLYTSFSNFTYWEWSAFGGFGFANGGNYDVRVIL